MKKFMIVIAFHFIYFTYAQTIPSLPIPICAGTAEVLDDSIYFFGGANRWAGTIRYPTVYKYDGSNWLLYDSIPDNSVWGMESVIVGTDVYLFAGWPSGARNVRKYNLLNKSWSYLAPGPNLIEYGITAGYVNNFIYLISKNGNVFEYNLTNDSWQAKTPNVLPAFSLSSAVYQDEIYTIGFYDSTFSHPFYKYNPASDTWVQLTDIPYQVSKCAMNVINDKIYCAGGSAQGSPSTQYDSLLVYDILSDSWSIDQFELSGKRLWMADVIYNNRFLVLGGFDSTSFAVDIVEEIIPLGSLPVELISFSANVENENVILNWKTASEQNNYGFEIQRKAPSKSPPKGETLGWMTINFVNGHGTTTETNNYSYTDKKLSSGYYSYRLKQIDFNGDYEYSDIIEVNLLQPKDFYLNQNYPNPFNPTTKISWQSPISSHQTLKIYDVLGREIVTLVNEEKAAGTYEVEWNATGFASGTYFYQLTSTPGGGQAGGNVETKKLTLIK